MTLPQTVSAREIQRGYRRIFDRVRKTKRPVVVMANNEPQGAIVSVDMLEEYNALRMEQEAFATMEKIQARNKNIPTKEAFDDITRNVEEVRSKRYANSQSNS